MNHGETGLTAEEIREKLEIFRCLDKKYPLHQTNSYGTLSQDNSMNKMQQQQRTLESYPY